MQRDMSGFYAQLLYLAQKPDIYHCIRSLCDMSGFYAQLSGTETRHILLHLLQLKEAGDSDCYRDSDV